MPSLSNQAIDGMRDVQIREATPKDAAAIAALFVLTYGGDIEELEALIANEIHHANMGVIQRHIFVAQKSNRIVGYGRSGRLGRDAIRDSRGINSGWYLLGLVVHPDDRRCGIGHALTAHRLNRLRKMARIVYYFASKDNRISIDLHESFGFHFLTADFHHPNPAFTEGGGLLFRRIQN